jgi:hypothetical protein
MVANAYGIDIAAQNGIKPNAATIAYYRIANYGSIFSQKAIFTDFWSKSPYRFYKCHTKFLFECEMQIYKFSAKNLLFSQFFTN